MSNSPAGSIPAEIKRNWLQALCKKYGVANRLTEARIVLSFVVLWQLWQLAAAGPAPTALEQFYLFWGTGVSPHQWGPGILFIFTGLLDTADGQVARWSLSESSYGKFLDPLSDKVFFYAVAVWIFACFHLGVPPEAMHWFIETAPLVAWNWYLFLIPMFALDCLSTRYHWLDYRAGVKKKKVDKPKGAKLAGRIKFWWQAVALGPFISTLCPWVEAVGFWQEASNFVAGFFITLLPNAWLVLAVALVLSFISHGEKLMERMKKKKSEQQPSEGKQAHNPPVSLRPVSSHGDAA